MLTKRTYTFDNLCVPQQRKDVSTPDPAHFAILKGGGGK
jgi:hypothetical protein